MTPLVQKALVAYPAVTVLWVALGGAIGASLRFGVSEGSRRLLATSAFPWATLLVNVMGSLALGFILRWAVASDASPQARAFLVFGVCGGFTTFSAFALETASLLETDQVARAALYSLASVVLAVAAVFAGYMLNASRG